MFFGGGVMRYLSLFSGIEAASVAWAPLGWECVGVAEIEPFPCAVLAHHYPDVPNLGSVTDITDKQIAALGPIDLVVGGSPCQDLSVAGKRAGLAGARSGLFHEQLRIFHAARTLCGARWLLWENVPGSFSSHGGKDFAVVVGAMAGADFAVPKGRWQNTGVALGSNGLVEWSVLDAQWVRTPGHPRAVPQRRRRVFALLDTGDWSDRPPVFLVESCLRGNPPPRREAGEVAPTIPARSLGGGDNGMAVAFAQNQRGELRTSDVAPQLTCGGGKPGEGYSAVAFGLTTEQTPKFYENAALTLTKQSPTGGGQPQAVVAFQPRFARNDRGAPSEVAYPLTAEAGKTGKGDSAQCVQSAMSVRRLTPVECSRLQGFPDDYLTQVPWRGKTPPADGPMYKALGNSFAVNVLSFIGQRIQEVSNG